MRKLRLIRPWRLQAVRQKAMYGRPDVLNPGIELVSCHGPQDNAAAGRDARGAFRPLQTATMAAPVSGVIFATGSNPRW